MNSVQSIDPILPLTNKLEEHFLAGEKCQEFFKAYDEGTLLPDDSKRAGALVKVHSNYKEAFAQMFSYISGQYLEKRSEELVKIEGSAEQVALLSEKINLCQKTEALFRAKMFEILKKSPDILLRSTTVFFLPNFEEYKGEMGECHCCEIMSRKNRSTFSRRLSGIIGYYFRKENPMTIASIGAGICFHELEIHTLFTAKGYNVNQWVLVDPDLPLKTASNFEMITNWDSPGTIVKPVAKRSDEYFADIIAGNSISKPDLFLFIDVDAHINWQKIKELSMKIPFPCLLAEFTKDATSVEDGIRFFPSFAKTTI